MFAVSDLPKGYPLVALLCSANRKASAPAPALTLYRSEFFQLGRSYIQQMAPTDIFILSAQHGLLHADDVVPPYHHTMSALAQSDGLPTWSGLILEQLAARMNVAQHAFVIMGLRSFVQPIASQLPYAATPLAGMNMVQALNFLRAQT